LTFLVANFAGITMEIMKHRSGVEVIRLKAPKEIIKHEERTSSISMDPGHPIDEATHRVRTNFKKGLTFPV
jgi:hypothetical protein